MARITKADKVAVMGLLAQVGDQGYPVAVLNKTGRAALNLLVTARLAEVPAGAVARAYATEAGAAWLAKAAS
jgi:hypothetical protein